MKTLIALMVLCLASCLATQPQEPITETPPSPAEWNAWARWVENQSPVSDDMGHGPDIGSEEWASALDRRLGISADGHGPDLKSAEWRRAVETRLAQ